MHTARHAQPRATPARWGPRPCGPQEYCRKARCSSRKGKSQGVCAPKAGCTETGGPVCGCDHKTYPTACAAQTAGESVKYAQECGPRSCGGRMAGDCGLEQYCRFSSPTCDRADRSGKCIDYPKTCGSDDAPVVSCAGQRFGSRPPNSTSPAKETRTPCTAPSPPSCRAPRAAPTRTQQQLRVREHRAAQGRGGPLARNRPPRPRWKHGQAPLRAHHRLRTCEVGARRRRRTSPSGRPSPIW